MRGGENMGEEIVNRIKAITEDLERTLVKLDFNLELYYDDELSLLEKDIFVDCKICQQDALGYTKDIQDVLKSLRKNN